MAQEAVTVLNGVMAEEAQVVEEEEEGEVVVHEARTSQKPQQVEDGVDETLVVELAPSLEQVQLKDKDSAGRRKLPRYFTECSTQTFNL